MKYFTQDYLNFFKELEKNNNKEWFDANRKRYEEVVKKPFEVFVQDLGSELLKFDAELYPDFKKCIFRINRDIRFSANKSPYKLNRSAAYSRNGKQDHDSPGYYIEVGYKRLLLAGGCWALSKENLYKVRKEIYYDVKEFNDILNDKSFKKIYGDIIGDKNKRLGKEETEWAEESPYIYNKQFCFWKEIDTKLILKDDFLETVVDDFHIAYPFLQFLRRALYDVD